MRRVLISIAAFTIVALASTAYAQTQDALRVGGNIRAPRKVVNVNPVYPEAARAQGLGGTVILELTISAQGTVDNARVIRSIPGLDEAAVTAVRQWTYEPTMLNGVAVPIIYNVTVTFTMQNAATQTPIPPPDFPPGAAGTALGHGFTTIDPALLDPPPVRVGGVIKAPTKIYDAAPIYPLIAQQANVEGVVILELLVDGTGVVANAKVIRSIPLLDDAALDAVRQWMYTPTLLNGVPVPIYYNVTISFSLK